MAQKFVQARNVVIGSLRPPRFRVRALKSPQKAGGKLWVCVCQGSILDSVLAKGEVLTWAAMGDTKTQVEFGMKSWCVSPDVVAS